MKSAFSLTDGKSRSSAQPVKSLTSCGLKAAVSKLAVSKLRADVTVVYSDFLIEAPHFVQNEASLLTAAPQAGQVSSETSGAGIFSPQPGQNWDEEDTSAPQAGQMTFPLSLLISARFPSIRALQDVMFPVIAANAASGASENLLKYR